MNRLVVLGIVAALGRDAAAAPGPSDYEQIKKALKQPRPGRGIDKAPAGAPGWCSELDDGDGRVWVGTHLGSYYAGWPVKFYELVAAARATCNLDPKHPVTQQAAQEVLQLWMNETGLAAADATESINLAIDKKRSEASKKELCQALAIDPEVAGAERAFLQAKRELFFCPGGMDDKISDIGGNQPMMHLVPWLDSSATPADELVRLALVAIDLQGFEKADDSYKKKLLLVYGLDQFDIKSLDPKKAVAMADVAPFKGNAFARVAIKERLGQVRLALMSFEDAVNKQIEKDPAWKDLLVTAPQKAAAAYLAEANELAAQLQRSAQFEQAAFGPSRKAIADCYPTLAKDLAGVLKPMKKDTATELVAAMNKSNVAGLLFRRVQACVAGSGDASQAVEMTRLAGLRVIRGPRQAAYFAMIDALGTIRADRAKFAIEEGDIPFDRDDILETLTNELARNGKSAGIGNYHVWTGKGVVKSAKKAKDGSLAVVFATDKQQIWEQSCKQLGRIVMFDHDGRPIYDQSCSGKVVTADVSPDPITVPAHLSEGIKPGRLITFGVSNSQEKRISMPLEVYADKKGKKLVAWYGIALD